jgi:hypothetical protein
MVSPIGPAYTPLFSGICELLESARRAAARTVNSIMTAAYWEIGRRIIKEEQKGRQKAEYGEQIVEQLARDLTGRFGRGFSRTNVFQMRQFYLAYQTIVQTSSGQSTQPEKIQTMSGELPRFPLSWSHYVRLFICDRHQVPAIL